MNPTLQRWLLEAIQASDRRRLARLVRQHPGLEIHPEASSNLAHAEFVLAPGARVRIEKGVAAERHPRGVVIHVGRDAELVIGADTWLRAELQPVLLFVFDGARMEIGAEGFLNGCHLSTKTRLRLGRRVLVGPGTRVFDSDQHAMDQDRPEKMAPVEIDDECWIAADVTVARGVHIGAHSIIGARSVVTADIPAHSLAYGIPARVHGAVGDRTGVP